MAKLIYAGPVPRTTDACISAAGHREVVYVLIGESHDPIYVGITRNLAGRFAKHHRRTWWPLVVDVHLLEIEGVDRRARRRAALNFEAELIRLLDPAFNIAGKVA